MLKLSLWISLVLVACGGKPPEAPEVAAPAPVDAVTQEVAPKDPHQVQVDSASARLAAGRKAFDDSDFGKAMLEAQRGIDVLGPDYGGIDDSATKIKMAKDRAEQGGASDGAKIMLRMLSERIEVARGHWKLTP